MKLTYNDTQHAYYLSGRRCKSVTTVAKIPDDTYSLDQWRKRQVAIGLASSPDLVERAAAHFADKETLNRIAEEAMEAAKAHDKAKRGTMVHRITESIDLSETVIETNLSKQVRSTYLQALDEAGLEVLPEYVERIVVYPEYHLCGKFDRIYLRKSDGRHVMGDVKTGESAIRYPHAVSIQLALYANAPLMAASFEGVSGSTEQFEQLPADLDREVGYVIHMPNPEEASIVGINIAAGWDAARQICFPTLEWRAKSDLLISLPERNTDARSHPGTDDRDAGGMSEHQQPNAEAVDDRPPLDSGDPAVAADAAPVLHQPDVLAGDPPAAGDAANTGKVENPVADSVPAAPTRDGLVAWVNYIKTHHPDLAPDLRTAWPDNVPTFKQAPDHTTDELILIYECLCTFEARHELAFLGTHSLPMLPLEALPEAIDALEHAFDAWAEDDNNLVASDVERQQYVKWIDDVNERTPELVPEISRRKNAVGLKKRLREDTWTVGELRRLGQIIAAVTKPR